MIYTLRLLLIFLFFFTHASAQSQSETEFTKIPDDYYLALIPDLPYSGPHRLSWGFYRPPIIWLQGQAVDMSKLRWPQFDKEQIPPSLSIASTNKIKLLIEDSKGQLIETVNLDKPFNFESYTSTAKKNPVSYRLQMEALPNRLNLTTRSYPWIVKKEIFKCEINIDRKQNLVKNSRLKSCLSTLKKLPQQTNQQWFLNIDWPEGLDNENLSFVSENERELRGIFRKAGHIYQSQKNNPKKFIATAGITKSELMPNIEFSFEKVLKKDLLFHVPAKEDQVLVMDKQTLPDGSSVESFGYPGDFIESRSAVMPTNLKPRVQVQFIPAKDQILKYRKTDFPELHTGLPGLLRPWQGSVFGDFNQLSSNRGERTSFLDLPGIQLSYKTNFYDLVPTGFYQTGLLHTGSSLTLSELQGGVKKKIAMLPWLSSFIGLHQYTLSGANPGTSRLGKMNAFAFGLSADHLSNEFLIKSRFNIFYSNTIGYEGLVEYGKLFERKSDFNIYYSLYLGYSRYASNITNKLQTKENFSEDRFRIGVGLGFVGPESN